jgi:transcriptional regulator of acetoin/glycerol metabolism
VGGPAHDIDAGDFPDHFLHTLERERLGAERDSDRDRLLTALEAANWNKTEAARRLSWSRMTVYRKMAKLNLGSLRFERARNARAG